MASRNLRSNSKSRGRPLRSHSVTKTKKVKNKVPGEKGRGRGRPPKLKLKQQQVQQQQQQQQLEKIKQKQNENKIEAIKEETNEETIKEEINEETIKEETKEETIKESKEEQKHLVERVSHVKRKRGRPRLTPSEQQENVKKKKLKIEEQIKSEEIERTKTSDSIQAEKHDPGPPRRQPRMASLNAIAKVNAVLDCYRPDKPKETIETNTVKKIEEESDKLSKITKSEKQNNKKDLLTIQSKKSIGKKSEKKNIIKKFPPESNFTKANKKDKILTDTDETSSDDDEIMTDIATPIETHDQAIQTEVYQNTKGIQTDSIIFPSDQSLRLCTCKKTSSAYEYFNKYSSGNCPFGNPLHVKSTVLAHCNSHAVAVPIVKRHTYFDNSETQYCYQGTTDNITSLLDHCIKRNFSHKSNYPKCAKLLYVAAQNKAVAAKKQQLEAKLMYNHNNTGNKNNLEKIIIPTLNVEPISIPTSNLQKLNNNNTNNKKLPLSAKFKAQKMKLPSKKKICNGWEFDGASFEEKYSIGKEVITRKYYQCVSRNNEVIRIYDAVILKSGLDTPDADFVARISSFWEDNIGQFEGEMMMSVQWYYKPEQAVSKGNEVIKGQPMEVFASRHKDDNSIACIIDRCYVVTFSQFCRFKAQKQLLLEKRKTKPAMVPEASKHRSRFIPSPDFDPSLVFFCRYGYDYRSGGKLIKSQY